MKLALAAAMLLLGCAGPTVHNVNKQPTNKYVWNCSDDGVNWRPTKEGKCPPNTNFERLEVK